MKISLKYILTLFTVYCSLQTAYSQSFELNPQVNVTAVATQNLGSDIQRLTATLQQQLTAFLTNRAWTKDVFTQNERIDCEFQLNITSRPATDQFTAELQVLSRRPIYKAGINSTLIDFDDKNVQFTYVENQAFDFTIQNFNNNITSLFAYYAYVIIATDYDSFSLLGGTEH